MDTLSLKKMLGACRPPVGDDVSILFMLVISSGSRKYATFCGSR